MDDEESTQKPNFVLISCFHYKLKQEIGFVVIIIILGRSIKAYTALNPNGATRNPEQKPPLNSDEDDACIHGTEHAQC